MFQRFLPSFLRDVVWVKVTTLGLTLFFILLSDAILSYWVPNFIQDSLGSSLVMGLVISFSSIVGLGADIIFPQIMRSITVRRLIYLGIFASFLFALFLFSATFRPFILILLIAMAVWGIYYELLSFGQQQFVADSTPLQMHSAVWGVLGIFKNLAYFLGPIIASAFLLRGTRFPLYIAALFAIIGFLILLLSGKSHNRKIDIELGDVNLKREIEHWMVLFEYVWPVVILSLYFGIIDATFWTTGAVLTQELSKVSFLGGLLLPFYTLPSLFVGFIIARWKVYKGKKRLAIKFFLLSNLVLMGMAITSNVIFLLLITFVSSFLLGIAYPFVDAVYSDIISRMGRERHHLIGLCSSSMSLAYIIGPIFAGLITKFMGERNTFAVVAVGGILISLILLIFTPKKLKLPQEEIKDWE